MENLEKLGYSKKEAAAVTSLSPRSIDYLLAQGKLKGIKINRRVVILARSLHRLMEQGLRPDGGNTKPTQNGGFQS